MSLKSRLGAFFRGVNRVCININILSKGQNTNFAILQIAHRLEKGMCVPFPKKLWGYEKADLLARLIIKESNKVNPDLFAINIGKGVLYSYMMCKSSLSDREESSKYEYLKNHVESYGLLLSDENACFGGVKSLSRNDVLSDGYDKLFLTRHSIRDFDNTTVSIQRVMEAVQLALRAPSACNRQASQVYVFSAKDRINAGSQNEFNADKFIVITGNIRAFSINEQNDWLVSSSIFAGYLSLALHSKGIGSCVIRKDLIEDSTYCKRLREMLSIPEDEQIIIEIAIGNYKEHFNVPISYRKNVDDIIHLSPDVQNNICNEGL